MLNYTLRRLAYLVPTLLGITVVTFFIVNLTPGDPFTAIRGGMIQSRISPEAYEQMLKLYGLDKPIHIRYITWVKRLLTFDFGDSFRNHRPVSALILERLPATLALNIASLFIALLISIPLGLYSALRQHSLFDKINGTILYMLYSLPDFWVALLLIILFGVKLKLLPISTGWKRSTRRILASSHTGWTAFAT